jgi:hypothetical protein
VILAVAGARLLTTRVLRGHAEHIRQRPPAILIDAGAVAAGLAELGLITAWLLAVAALLLVIGVVLSLPPPSVQLTDLASGKRLDLNLDEDTADQSDSPTLQNDDR